MRRCGCCCKFVCVVCCLVMMLVAFVTSFFGSYGMWAMYELHVNLHRDFLIALSMTFNLMLQERCVMAEDRHFRPDELPWTHEMQQNWKVLRDEFYEFVSRGGPVPAFYELEAQQEKLVGGEWGSLWLKVYGQNLPVLEEHFPRTTALLQKTPISSAMISILGPDSHVKPHSGDWKGVLRYHIPLELPEKTPSSPWSNISVKWTHRGVENKKLPSGLYVSSDFNQISDRFQNDDWTGQQLNFWHKGWAAGEHFLFDDLFPHFVKNGDGHGRRVMFFADVPRHDCGWRSHVITLCAHSVLKRIHPRIMNLIRRATRFNPPGTKLTEL
ncbi:unnamed protein product [Prorocentrum cordatum]|uniref:Aspartyl/asparaginy/proline hydroxylase domain-containing protein n=1 Tax=Prorocentrum cordatum TaxID=2364126 RepID=A0ABN9PF26_9DINO|nr:unnamed protein product [Polarella glacialis]